MKGKNAMPDSRYRCMKKGWSGRKSLGCGMLGTACWCAPCVSIAYRILQSSPSGNQLFRAQALAAVEC
jgi:hypothetical protein